MNISSDQAHTDEQLLLLTLTSKEYFAELIERYEDKLRRYVKRLGVSSPEDVTDLLQNIFIKVYQNIRAFDPSLKFSSWIYRIAHNETISHFRHLRARPDGHRTDLSDEDFESIASDADIVRDSERMQVGGKIGEIVDKLDEKYKSVVVLHYFEYKGYEEISDILRMPPGTVAVRLRRAKEKIRKQLIEKGYVHE